MARALTRKVQLATRVRSTARVVAFGRMPAPTAPFASAPQPATMAPDAGRSRYWYDVGRDMGIPALGLLIAGCLGAGQIFLTSEQNAILDKQNTTMDKQADIQINVIEWKRGQQLHSQAMARKEVEANAADAMAMMLGALDAAKQAHHKGVGTDYRAMLGDTRIAMEQSDGAWATIWTSAPNALMHVDDIVHPCMQSDRLPLARAELHYYYASTCLHCVDEGLAPLVRGEPTEHSKRTVAKQLIDDAHQSLTVAMRCVAAIPVSSRSEIDEVNMLKRRICLRLADVESYTHAIFEGRAGADQPYVSREANVLSIGTYRSDAAEARYTARWANNYAMALLGAKKYDQALGEMGKAVRLLFREDIVNATAASIAAGGCPDTETATEAETYTSASPKLRALSMQVSKADKELRAARRGDRDRLACRKMLSTACTWLFLASQQPSSTLRDDLMRVVCGDRAMIAEPMPPLGPLTGERGKDTDSLAALRQHLVTADACWLKRRGFVRLLVAMHEALAVVPTDDQEATDKLAKTAIDTAAKLSTRLCPVTGHNESVSGDWGVYAYWVSEGQSWSHTDLVRAPQFSELGRARSLEELATSSAKRHTTRCSSGAALSTMDRNRISALLLSIRKACGLDSD